MTRARIGSPLLVVAAIAGALGVRAGAASGSSPPSCATRSLVVWLDTRGEGTAGSTYFRLGLANLSPRPCSLHGYPGVSAVDLAGRQLGSAAARNPRGPDRTVVLAPGKSASSVLQVTDVGVFAKTACRPVTAAGLRVYPPNQTASKPVPFPFRACSRAGRVYLHVATVTSAAP